MNWPFDSYIVHFLLTLLMNTLTITIIRRYSLVSEIFIWSSFIKNRWKLKRYSKSMKGVNGEKQDESYVHKKLKWLVTELKSLYEFLFHNFFIWGEVNSWSFSSNRQFVTDYEVIRTKGRQVKGQRNVVFF